VHLKSIFNFESSTLMRRPRFCALLRRGILERPARGAAHASLRRVPVDTHARGHRHTPSRDVAALAAVRAVQRAAAMPMLLEPISPMRGALGWRACAILAAAITGGVAAQRAAPREVSPPAMVAPALVPLVVPSPPAITAPVLVPLVLPSPPFELRGATTASLGRWRLVWTARQVFRADDGDTSFYPVLARAGVVRDAAFDRHGNVHVLRGNGWLGRADRYGYEPETWTYVGRFHDPDGPGANRDARPRLLVSGDHVAVLGFDPAAPTRIVMARRSRAGGWTLVPLFADTSYPWDEVEVSSIEPATGGRVRVIVKTSADRVAGDCGGYELFHELLVDVRRGTARTRQLDGQPPER
jgi:hypothetical protein